MSQFRFTRFNVLPPVIKNLLIINGLVYLATLVWTDWFMTNLSLYYFDSPLFKPVQIATHMFMHDPSNFAHLFFNMLALWMFGAVLENFWGPQRFLTYYLITGIGAAFLHQAFNAYQLYEITGSIYEPSVAALFSNEQADKIASVLYVPTVGASGAVYGILLAFGMLFPNTLVYIYFLFPIKAKFLVIFLIAIELYFGFLNSPTDNIAHFAHLGGMLFGFLMIKIWGRQRTHFF